MSIETMTKLATVTVGSGGSSTIEFTNIPQTYTDLVIKLSGRASSPYLDIKFNNTTSNRSARYLYGNGSSAGSGTQAGFLGMASSTSNTASTFGSMEVYIPNYTSSNYKTYSSDSAQETNATSAELQLVAGLWSDTSAINQITVLPSSGTFSEFSTATLYGIRNMARAAGNSVKAIGGNISFDGTYVVHTFNSSGTFTALQTLTCDYLIVAGGGGGNSDMSGGGYGGGGGAGGYRYFTGQTVTSGAKTVTVGGGGTGINTGGGASNRGGDSSFNGASSTGGGSGGGPNNNGAAGGSGGGARSQINNLTPGTGNLGGYSPAEGTNGSGTNGGGAVSAGPGGGASNSITGSAITYSTGGNGGSGGADSAGAANTGNGASGGSSGTGKTGGSGIVIVRYKA